jgi:ketosteroid isomerase-like protein
MSEESMTRDPVELSRRFLEAANRLDFDAMMSFWAPDAVYVWTEFGMATGEIRAAFSFEGRAEIRKAFEDMASSFDEIHGEFEEIVDLGNGVVFSVIILTGRPVGSSGEVRNRFASVGIWNESVIERSSDYADIDEARAAAERLAEERR